MAKFKVGDRVRFTDACSAFWWFGPHTRFKEGVVSSVNQFGSDYNVSIEGSADNDYGVVAGGEIELIEPVIAPAITAPSAVASAVRTVTRREIVPGEYLDGNVKIIANGCALVRDWSDASKARAAASLFNELADVLDENAANREVEAA